MLSEERAEHDQTEKKLRRAKNDLDNARQQLNDHRSVSNFLTGIQVFSNFF